MAPDHTAVIFQICVAPSWQLHTLRHIFIFFPSVVFKEYAGKSPLPKKFPAQNPCLFEFLISVSLCTSDQSLPDSSVEFQIELKIDFNGQLLYVCGGISTGKRNLLNIYKKLFFF